MSGINSWGDAAFSEGKTLPNAGPFTHVKSTLAAFNAFVLPPMFLVFIAVRLPLLQITCHLLMRQSLMRMACASEQSTDSTTTAKRNALSPKSRQ